MVSMEHFQRRTIESRLGDRDRLWRTVGVERRGIERDEGKEKEKLEEKERERGRETEI